MYQPVEPLILPNTSISLSAISHQSSAIRYKLSVISYTLSTIRYFYQTGPKWDIIIYRSLSKYKNLCIQCIRNWNIRHFQL